MFRLKVEFVMWSGREKCVIPSGTIQEGTVRPGDLITIRRGSREVPARVKQVDTANKFNLPQADVSTKFVALRLEGITPDDVQEGDMLEGAG